jgi:DNA polymerase elongation subunit (family B)
MTENNLRCSHRHLITEHPRCFEGGKPKIFSKSKGLPKVLLLDIETAIMEVYTYGIYEQVIRPNQIKKDWFVLSWSAKWLYSAEVKSSVVTRREAILRNDKRIISELWDLLNEADIVITHNGNRFDLPKINTRLLIHGFPPPSYYRTIDTLLIARQVFGFTSNKLDYLNKALGIDLKDDMSMEDWIQCSRGNEETLKKMEKYNRGDVVNLEDLYLVVRPWIQNHPNIGVYIQTEDGVCRNCGSSELNWEGYYYSNTGKYRSFRCNCGAVGRDKVNLLSNKKRKNLTT